MTHPPGGSVPAAPRLPGRGRAGGLGGYAGQRDLLQWFDSLAHSRPRVILTHGEDKPRDHLRRLIADRHQLNAECPKLNEVITF